jgi:predicted Rossmann fold nucleotide-binding protein DprA/Smf involved in DNA uptake
LVLSRLSAEPIVAAALAELVELSSSELLSVLLTLEIEGVIKAGPGGYRLA